MYQSRIEFLDLPFDLLDPDQVVAWIVDRASDAPFAYIVTPNVDHMVRLSREPTSGAVREAYDAAALCLCDSRILALLARLFGITLTVVPGSDLTVSLLDRVRPGDRLCLIGGDDALRRDMEARFPDCPLVQHIPPMALRQNETALDIAASFAAKSNARFVLLAVGSPQQELLAHRIARRTDARGTGLCIGASVEFVTGATARAPMWMRRAGLEWLHRLLSNPRRLWRRYLVEGPRIFLLVLQWRLHR